MHSTTLCPVLDIYSIAHSCCSQAFHLVPHFHTNTSPCSPWAARTACPWQWAQAAEEFCCGSFPGGPGASNEVEVQEGLECHSEFRIKWEEWSIGPNLNLFRSIIQYIYIKKIHFLMLMGDLGNKWSAIFWKNVCSTTNVWLWTTQRCAEEWPTSRNWL